MYALIHWVKNKTISTVPLDDCLTSKQENTESIVKFGKSKCKGVIKKIHGK